ncbi:ribokinase [Devosia sp.]|uniref:ribokinase n=1 Tax=Devosia sp. TaxID=1871048 RepID=UPI003266D32E
MITVFGSTGLDQIGTVPRLPGPGETVLGGVFASAPGGKGANQALAAKRAGADVRHVSAVGDDAFAAQALALLKAGGVDLSLVKTVPGATAIAMIFVDAHGENCIAVLPGANATVSADEAETALSKLPPGAVVMLQQEISQSATERALDIAKANGLVSILNTAPYLETTKTLAHKASILVANETEFALLSNSTPAELDTAMAAWVKQHGQTLIVTLGKDGAKAVTPTSAFSVPSLAITPVDTVGAGDTFCGYLAAGLDAGLDLEAAMRRAAYAGSLACLKPGAQPAIPFAAEVDKALAS